MVRTLTLEQGLYCGVNIMSNVQIKTIKNMTPEEIAAWEQSIADTPAPEPTAEERIAALEDELAATKILLGLEE